MLSLRNHTGFLCLGKVLSVKSIVQKGKTVNDTKNNFAPFKFEFINYLEFHNTFITKTIFQNWKFD